MPIVAKFGSKCDRSEVQRIHQRPRISTFLSLLLILVSVAHASFSDDQVPQRPDILAQILEGLSRSGDSRLISMGDAQSAYYLRSLDYIGECKTAFGTVHLVATGYTRSAQRGSKNPARGHAFLVFLDESFCVKGLWTTGFDLSLLTIQNGCEVHFGNSLAFDYSRLPEFKRLDGEDVALPHIAIDGEVFTIPVWARAE